MEPSDEYLIQKYLHGDTSRFNVLIQRWQKRIFNFIYRNLGDYEEARDLTQDTFAKVFLKLKDLDDTSKFSSWIYKVALNECRMAFRRAKGRQKVPLEIYHQTEAQGDEFCRIKSEEESPEEHLQKKESVDRLREMIRMIPEEQRAVILMKEYENLKFHEIAEILDVPLSTVKSRMYLGLRTLRRLLIQKELTRR
ncbi:MAG: sigma-70 family RNA polymerase sigma factor [Acidobacteria bacterium]|nr:sigma-70 family RNA polymerase sigma factor [Acidobacteriota bacterium]